MRIFILALCLPAFPAKAQMAMVTYHNDNARTGLNPNETLLTPANVNGQSFGKLFSHPVDGQVFTQPLIVPNLSIGGAVHNVVFIATEHDSVYAFDADGAQGGNAGPLWQASFLSADGSVTPVPYLEIASCPDIVPESGITDTPAIDLSTNTLYVVAETKEVSYAAASRTRRHPAAATGGAVTQYVHRLHALDLSTGAEKFGGPVPIQAVWNGGGGPVTFVSQWQINRPGLLLTGGLLYTFWASHCDDGQYYGWVLAYDPSALSLQSVFNMAPVSERGGIWQSGAPPAIDSDGTFFMNTATGTFDAASGGIDYGESIIHFLPGLNPGIIDYFSPYNEAQLDATDNEMGSVGEMILPDEAGSADHPYLTTGGDKAGDVFLLDRDYLGGFQNGPNGTDAVVQEFHPAPTNNFAIFTTPCYYNGNVYWSSVNSPIQSFSISNGQYNTTPTSSTPESYIYPGCTPSVSSNGPNYYGILWAIQPGTPAVLRAYDANNLGIELYDSTFAPNGQDDVGSPNTKFTPPTVVNGKVYVPTGNSLVVYGLLATPRASAARPLAVKETPTPSSTTTPGKTSTASPTSTSTPTQTPTPTPIVRSGPVIVLPNLIKPGQGPAVFQVPEGGATLEISIYDVVGERVAQMAGPPGSSRCSWDTVGLASGLYLARVQVTDADGSGRRQILKVVVVH